MAMIKERMSKKFPLSDQGELDYYLGVEVTKLDENTMLLHQTAYAKKSSREIQYDRLQN